MLEVYDKDNQLSFTMSVSTSRKINIYWRDLESKLKEERDHKKIVFIDPLVLGLFPKLINLETNLAGLSIIPTNIGEKEKNMETLSSILSIMEQEGIGRRNDQIYAVGGGVLLDMVSFACSMYRRGIHVTKVPTTLLAYIDASIGIKTGINFLGHRNRLGSYNARFDVLLDANFLKVLDKGLIKEGLGEMFKIALIKSNVLFKKIEESIPYLLNSKFYTEPKGKELLSLSLKLMLEELHENPEEDLLKRSVDFGHTFSPLVEMESINNSRYRKIPHGFAVAYDCMLTSAISNRRGYLTDALFSRICELYLSFDFDFKNSVYLENDLIWASALEMTKHRGGDQHIPVPTGIGQFDFIEDLTYNELLEAKKHLDLFI